MLLEYGGMTPVDDRPIWRLVLAQNCRIRCFGWMNHIAAGTDLQALEKPEDLVPERIEEGEFWIPRTRVKGWILQRWFAASVWGTREAWESQKARDGKTRLLAAWPANGDYLMMYGPWDSIEAAGDLRAAIREYNKARTLNPVNWDNYEAAMIVREAQERQEMADRYAEELEATQRSEVAPILRSVSTAAQEYRDAVAEQAAGGVNLGASEKWG